MSDPENGPAQILAERLRFGAGFSAEDSDHVLELLAPLGRHLVRWSPEDVDLELQVKNRGGPEQKVTLEAWLPRWPSLVASSIDRDLDHALVKVRKDMIREIDDQKSKHEPRSDRGSRRKTA
jgi:hypothetical protein